MMKKLLALSCLLTTVGCGAADVPDLGRSQNPSRDVEIPRDMDATDPSVCRAHDLITHALPYNVVALRDFVAGHSDTEGRVAAGGDIRVWHYAVGLRDPNGDVAIAGGSLEARDAAFHGDVVVGATAQLDNAGLYPTDGSSGSSRRGMPLDFDVLGDDLTAASDLLGTVGATGPTIRAGQAIHMVGGRDDVNVFAISAHHLEGASSLTFDVPAGANVVVNIRGGTVRFQDFGVFGESLDPTRVLFNAPEAWSVRIEAFDFSGSLLAPRADVDFDNGQFNGQLVAWSVQGDGLADGLPDGQFNHRPYRPPVCPVVEVCEVDALLAGVTPYNVYVAEDFVAGHSDVEGRLAAGGNIDLHHYAVGLRDPDGLVAVAGGWLRARDAGIYGDVAGAAGVDLERVGLRRSGGERGEAWHFLADDFPARTAELRRASEALATRRANGLVETHGRSLELRGDSRVNDFVLHSDELRVADRLNIDVPEGATAIVHITGDRVQFSNFGVFTDLPPERLLFHAPMATAVRIEAFGFVGSLLAPRAAVDFDNGRFDGSLFALRFDGDGLADGLPDGQFNHRPFQGGICE